jgi:beta-glucosidase
MPFIDQLLGAMTLAEKIGQLTMGTGDHAVTGPVLARDVTEAVRKGNIGSLLNYWGAEPVAAIQKVAVEESRLGIPLLIGFDVLHGHRTIFPIPLAEAASFDPAIWESTAREAAIEAARDGIALTFAPMLDVARDPRWGRIAESPGEDPWIAARFAEAKIRGFQGNDLSSPSALAATAKHFCAYGAALAGRDYASVDVSEQLLHEVFLPPFGAAVAAGCAAVMPAFNDIAGIPMTAHIPLLRQWLRQAHGFDGVIVSDYHAIEEFLCHGTAAGLAEAAAAALKAGVDIDMMSDAYPLGLPEALKRGLVTMADVDQSVRRVLVLKQRLGLFKAPFARGARIEPAPDEKKTRLALAREAARRAIVLLTNDTILPLPETARKIAVIGPLAEAAGEMGGPWAASGAPHDWISIADGLAAALPDRELMVTAGVGIDGEDPSGIVTALDLCAQADVILLCLGERANMSGEAASRANPILPGRQASLAEAVLRLGKPVVVLLSSGRPLMIPDIVEKANAVVATWFLGAEAGTAVADVLTGQFNPTGRLPVSWPRDIGQVPIYFASRPSGRPADPKNSYTSKYLDMPNEPLFFFGHGLSYTRFSLQNLRSASSTIRRDQSIIIEVEAKNEGDMAGEETIFLFTHDPVASVGRPVLELKSMAKAKLAPGQGAKVHLRLKGEDLCYPGLDFQPFFEPGDVEILAGPSADPRRLLRLTLRMIS